MDRTRNRRNVVVIVLDDVGFGQLGCYGGPIETPNIDAVAARGARLGSFHTTALCAPTRSSLLTGRHHHRNGMGSLPLRATADPGYNARTPFAHGYLSEILRDQGYATVAIGKWHLTPYEDMSAAGPFDQWPLGRGFDHYYGFMHAETDQWRPRLVRDNSFVDPPGTEGYHLSADLTDEAVRQIRDIRTADPERPFFLYFCPAAAHAPLQAPQEYVTRYRGRFDHGWRREAELTLERQKGLGLVPPQVMLPAWPDDVPDWESLDEHQRAVAARLQEVFAGFLSHLDDQLGRLFAAIRELGEEDETMIVLVSDNGASGEGGALGTTNELRRLNRVEEDLAAAVAALDHLGARGTYPHYPTGWALAGNTPFRNMKKWTHEGGIADPAVITIPWADDVPSTVPDYVHVTDIAPTVLEALGIAAPPEIRGVRQASVDGGSFLGALRGGRYERGPQYYESMGHRAIWRDGWKAVSSHVPQSGTGNFDADTWELYHTAVDPTESNDVAAEHPERLRELVALWHDLAGSNQVLPLDDSKTRDPLFVAAGTRPRRVRHYPGSAGVQQWTSPALRRRSFRIDTVLDAGAHGPVVAVGGRVGGFGLWTEPGLVGFAYAFLDVARTVIEAPIPAQGEVRIGVVVEIREDTSAEVTIDVDGATRARGSLDRTIRLRFDAEGATYAGRDPFGVLDGLSHGVRSDDRPVDLTVLDERDASSDADHEVELIAQ